jgi:outer membrane biosynthesis protein TonB
VETLYVSESFLGPEPLTQRKLSLRHALLFALAASLAAIVCWAPVARAQEVTLPQPSQSAADTTDGGSPAATVDPAGQPPADPAPQPEPVPAPGPPPPPDNQAQPPPDPITPPDETATPADPSPVHEASGHTETPATRDSATADSAPQTQAVSSTQTVGGDAFGPAAALPVTGAGGGGDWFLTAEGDEFVAAIPGTGGGGTPGGPTGAIARALLGAAGPAAKLEAGKRQRHEAAEARALGSGGPGSGPGSGSRSFFNLFTGGSGGSGVVLLLGLFGILSVWRVLPPDWTRAFRMPTTTWRPAAYIPPIQHPG